MKFLLKAAAPFKKQAAPRSCLLTVTNSCMLSCKMCHLWRLDTAKDEMTIEECKRLIDKLGEFEKPPEEIHLIGGEPLIKRGILELIAHISRFGVRTIMTSCGYTIDEETAVRIAESGLSMLNVSLDSLNPQTHNFLRGKSDCFDRVMKALGFLMKVKPVNMKLGINTVISSSNLDDLPALIDWVQENRALDTIYFMATMRPFGSNLGWDWYKKEEFGFLWPHDTRKVKGMLDCIISMKKKGAWKISNQTGQLQDFKAYFGNPDRFIKTRRCNLQHRAVNVNAVGDVFLCFFMEKLGNIRQEHIVQMWRSDKAEQIRSGMRSCKNNCELVVNCYYGKERFRSLTILAQRLRQCIPSVFRLGKNTVNQKRKDGRGTYDPEK